MSCPQILLSRPPFPPSSSFIRVSQERQVKCARLPKGWSTKPVIYVFEGGKLSWASKLFPF